MATYVDDGNLSFMGGQNDGLLADSIREDQYQRGVNVTTKDGAISPRPGFVHQEITVITTGSVEGRSYQKIFNTGKFQAATSYDTDSGTFIIAVISGIIFRVDPRTLEATVIPIGDSEDSEDRMNQYRRKINWSYAGRFLVFFDFPNIPVIIENSDARRAVLDDYEVFASSLGTYVQSRLWIGNAVHQFTAGDPVGGINSNAPITFEEVLAPASAFGGQVFSLGSQSANQPITAMGVLQVADTSTGIGPLFVATKNSVYLYQANLPRSQWDEAAFGRMVLYNAGIAGERAFTNLNSDLLFLSGDNQVRSLLMGKSGQERWENAPMSREVNPWLQEFKNEELISNTVAVSHGNRVFISVAPYRTHAISLDSQKVFDYAHGGMVVLELDNVSALGQAATPTWAGLWTGISPMELITLNNGLYIFSKDDGGINRLYLMDEDKTWDVFKGEEVDIVSRIYTREYNFKSPFQDKRVGSVSYSMSNIEGAFTFISEYQPGHSEKWTMWKNFKHCAETEICDAGDDCGVNQCEMPTLNSHSFRELDFGDPIAKSCDLLTNEQSDVLRKVKLRLTMKGRNWKLRDIHLRFSLETNTNRPATQRCESIEQRKLCAEIEPNDWEFYRTATRSAGWPQMTLTL
ncbi:MAG TPA: hypothetical protein VMW91_05320 [Desulfosporosinus sp.]|nr:hypothetical protein [Desulfosporosinus sp.]